MNSLDFNSNSLHSAKNYDIFNSSINYNSDPMFIYIKEIQKHLIIALITNYDIVLSHNLEIPRQPTASKIFNTLTTASDKTLINEYELTLIANAFKASIAKSNSHLSLVSNKFDDNIKHLAYFTKYLYIPVRLDYTTIPEDQQIKFLRAWLTTIVVLIANNNYSSRFANIIPKLDIFKTCSDKLANDENVRINMKSMDYAKINQMLINKAPPTNSLHNYIEIFNILLSNINSEIVSKFCPNYNECLAVNSIYDGKWLSPFDGDVSEQLKSIRGQK